MTQDEFENLYIDLGINIISHLQDTSNHTLLYGYTAERNSFHVYIDDGEVVVCIYKTGNPTPLYYYKDSRHILNSLVPNKRVYPETCDVDFCHLLISAGINITFTVYDHTREPRKYYGDVFNNGLS